MTSEDIGVLQPMEVAMEHPRTRSTGYSATGQRRQETAEELAASSLAADEDRWLTYVPTKGREPFEQWLHSAMPSQISRSDGVGWICVIAPTNESDEVEDSEVTELGGLEVKDTDHDRPEQEETGLECLEEEETDLDCLEEAWEELQASGRVINQQSITQLAQDHDVLSGKWLFHVGSGPKVDILWRLVARAVVAGRCGSSAKVSPHDPEGDSCHVVCIYNDDFTDRDAVLRLESQIRGIGIKCPLSYKPDVYTHVGVYRRNKWGIRPTIYHSVYDIREGASVVTEGDNRSGNQRRLWQDSCDK